MKTMLITTLVVLFGIYQSFAEKLCNPGWTRGAGKAPKKCEDNVPEYEAGLCYEECDKGYEGIGPICWEKCKDGEIDDGATCRVPILSITKSWYDRGAGTVPKDCGEGREKQAGLCYTECKPGYSGKATMCYQDCPGGYKENIGNSCYRHIMDWFTKKSYGRGIGKAPQWCPKGKENVAGLCYTKPKKGYSCVVTHCTKDCPKGATDRGSICEHTPKPKPKNDNQQPKEHGPGKDLEPGIRGKGTHTRGAGVIPSKCDADEEKLVALCYPKCGRGYWGDVIFCRSNNFREHHFPSLKHSLPSVKDVGETCSLDLVVDTILSAKDFNNIQFGAKDMDKCLMENVNKQLDDQWDQKTAVTAIEIDMAVTEDGNGLLQHVMSLSDIEFAEFKDFEASCSKHANADAMDKFDDFLKWFYDEVKVQNRKNVYVGIAFEPKPKKDEPKQPSSNTLTIKSLEHSEYSGTGRYFDFDSADIDAMLGREDWNGEIFEVYVDRLHEIMPIALFRETGHGRKSPRDVAADGDWEIDDTITFSQVGSGCDPTCGCGYKFSSRDIKGKSKDWTNPGMGIDNCARECSKRDGCTGFEYNHEGNENYACGTYTGGDSDLAGERANLRWTTCVVTKSNPPQPAGQHDKGLDVYFYYGACDGGKVSIGSNIVVYRSKDDIIKKRQVYAPFNELKFGDDVNVNSMYGLSENGCSLNYMGVSMFPKGDEKWFDWDGHECKAEGILKLN